MEYINIEKFRAFLDENLKQPFGCYDLDTCIADFERQVEETGSDCYELGAGETTSGKPETISFDRENRFMRDGHEVSPKDDWDTAEVRIIF